MVPIGVHYRGVHCMQCMLHMPEVVMIIVSDTQICSDVTALDKNSN